MTVSPLIALSPSAVNASSSPGVRGKSTVSRTSANDTDDTGSPVLGISGQGELAQQLNEDVRRKYVKGNTQSCLVISLILSTTDERICR